MVANMVLVGRGVPPVRAWRKAAAQARWPLSWRPFQSALPSSFTERKSSMTSRRGPDVTSIHSLPALGSALP